MMFELDLKTLLGLSVIGTLVSTLGILIGIILKEYLFARSFERWKQKREVERIYLKYRDPISLASRELARRVGEIIKHYPTVYLSSEVFKTQPARQENNSIHDEYFQKYKLVSSLYRISSFFAWIELYRQEIALLTREGHSDSKQLDTALERIREDLADGQLNKAIDLSSWSDILIFREEIRAIGESLIWMQNSTQTVIGYGQYCFLIESAKPNQVKKWSRVAMNFLVDLKDGQTDFRKTRLTRLFTHLVETIRLLDKNPIDPHLEKLYESITRK